MSNRSAGPRTNQLPTASSAVVRAYARVLMRQHRRPLIRMLSLYAFAAIMGLIPAWVIGEITDFASDHQLNAHKIALYVGVLVVASLAYAVLTFFARRRSYVLGEIVFAQLREEFLQSMLALPLVEVERRRDRGPAESHDQRHGGTLTNGSLRRPRMAGGHPPSSLDSRRHVVGQSPRQRGQSRVAAGALLFDTLSTCATRRPGIVANASVTPHCREPSRKRPRVRARSTPTDSGRDKLRGSKTMFESRSTPRCTPS